MPRGKPSPVVLITDAAPAPARVVAWLVWLAISVQFVVNPVVGGVGFTLALLVFWSCLYLTRHDLRETLVGAFLGLLGGPVTAW